MIAGGGRGLVFSSFPVSKKGLLSFERRFFFFFLEFSMRKILIEACLSSDFNLVIG